VHQFDGRRIGFRDQRHPIDRADARIRGRERDRKIDMLPRRIQADAVDANRKGTAAGKQRALQLHLRRAASGRDSPNDTLERIAHIKITVIGEGEIVGQGARARKTRAEYAGRQVGEGVRIGLLQIGFAFLSEAQDAFPLSGRRKQLRGQRVEPLLRIHRIAAQGMLKSSIFPGNGNRALELAGITFVNQNRGGAGPGGAGRRRTRDINSIALYRNALRKAWRGRLGRKRLDVAILAGVGLASPTNAASAPLTQRPFIENGLNTVKRFIMRASVVLICQFFPKASFLRDRRHYRRGRFRRPEGFMKSSWNLVNTALSPHAARRKDAVASIFRGNCVKRPDKVVYIHRLGEETSFASISAPIEFPRAFK